jgi:hypothetical protein
MNALAMGAAGLLGRVCKTQPAGSIPDASTNMCPSAGTGRQARFATACPFRASGSDPRLGQYPNQESG